MESTTLVLCWGNPGRRDDGLGPALGEALAQRDLPRVVVDSDYQLQVEAAAEVARHRRVVFVDAARRGTEPFWTRRLAAGGEAPGFSTHSVSPEALLTLARDLFGAEPEAWILGIRGYEFDDFSEGLSDGARRNLGAALEYLESALGGDGLREIGAGQPPDTTQSDREGEPCQTISP